MSATIPHILIIDDNEAILDSVAMVLRWNALRVSAANQMTDFHGEIHAIEPDLVLLDKALGWADGCDLCVSLKTCNDTSHIPVIMFSAMPQSRDLCIRSGADAFLEKPFDMDELLRLIYTHSRHAPSYT